MSDIIYLNSAKTDLKGIWNHTKEKWGVAQADKYLLAIEETISLISQNPEIGSSRDYVRQGYRGFLSGRHIIYYTVQSETIRIVRILHERMDAARHIQVS